MMSFGYYYHPTTEYICGCYYRLDSTDYYTKIKKHYLPLLDTEAQSTILSTTSRTVLKQTFTNPSTSDTIKECIYTFPLYDGVSVVSFTCRIGKKLLTGRVKEKLKAKQMFNDAVAKGQTAGLLEQAPESSDVFSTKLGNIPAGASVIVEITYIGELKHHETEGIRFTIPTSIAPRYGDGPSTGYQSNLPPKDGSGIKITVDVNMPEGSFVKGIQSPSHPIAVSMGTVSTGTKASPTMSKASASLSLGSAALEKDFVLVVNAKDIGIPKAILETHPTVPHHRAMMVTLVPKFSLPPSRPEIVFVADRSGSMGNNIQMLVSAMKVFLKSIPVSVKFNICSFGSSYSFLWPKSKPYTAETLEKAANHLRFFSADMGGTETFNAIKATIDRRFPDIPLEVILLTDGDIWNQAQLFEYVNQQTEQSNGNIRVFPLGIGSGVSHALIEGLARAGNGFASAVQNGERLENAVVRMLRGALSPHITDYTLEVKYEKKDDDFELIDKVTEGMKVLLSEDEKSPNLQAKKPTISLFDTNVDPEKDNVKGSDSPYAHLPNIPYPKLLQAPHKIPSLFAFSRTSVYLLLSPDTIQRNPTVVVLRATSTHGPLALEIPVEALAAPGKTIHQLAAKKAVQDLEEGRGWICDAKDQKGKLVKDRYPSCFDELVQKEAVRLGEKFQIAGKWTSFVAVEANDKEIAARQEQTQERASRAQFATIDNGMDFNAAAGNLDVLQDFDFDSFLHNENSQKEITGVSFPASESHSRSPVSPPASHPTPNSQDYQMGLMLLEQQNKNRFMMAGPTRPQAMAQRQAIRPSQAMMQQGTISSHAMKQQQCMMLQQQAMMAPQAMQQQQAMMAPQAMSQQRGMMSPQSTGMIQPIMQHSSNIGGASTDIPASQQVEIIDSWAPAPAPYARGFGTLPPSYQATAFHSPGPADLQQLSNMSQSAFSSAAASLPLASARRGSKRSAEGSTVRLGKRTSARNPCSEGGYYQSPSPPAPVDWSAKSTIEKMLALIAIQQFDGSWSASNSEISQILGFEVANGKGDQNVWVTLLVVKYFEEKLGDEEGTWGLVVEKARVWLSVYGVTDLDDLEAEAGRVILKS